MSNKKILFSNGVKKILLVSFLVLFLGLAPHAFAQGFVPLAPIPGLTQGTVANSDGLANFFNNLYKYLIGLAAVLAVIMIIWGGLEYSTQDSISKKSDGKERIYNAIFGLVLVLAPVLVFSIINPSILNLSINLPKLDTASGTTPDGGGPVTIDPTTGCRTTGISGILQITTCPSVDAATKWASSNSCATGNWDLSTGPQVTLSDGSVASTVMTCTRGQDFGFIDVHDASFSFSVIGAINTLQPLAIAGTVLSNGADAVQFASICKGAGIGWQTCISNDPVFTSATPCLPKPTTTPPSKAPKFPDGSPECYVEKLSCNEPSSLIGAGKCSGSLSWTPFQ